MSHRSITVLALVVTGALAATTVSMPTAFAADDENHVQSTVTPNSDTPAPEATQASSNDAQSGAPAPSDATDEAGDESTSSTPEPADDTPTRSSSNWRTATSVFPGITASSDCRPQ